jgi:DNA-binding LacI/PurR family transcriptional regulator
VVGIARDFAEIGRCAARLMIDRLTGTRTEPPVAITLPSRSVLAEHARSVRPSLQVAAGCKC